VSTSVSASSSSFKSSTERFSKTSASNSTGSALSSVPVTAIFANPS